MGGLKQETSLQDVLRRQMQEQELGGGGFGSPPGGGDGGDGSGESEEEEFAAIIDEFVQVILATLGFIFVVNFLFISVYFGEYCFCILISTIFSFFFH